MSTSAPNKQRPETPLVALHPAAGHGTYHNAGVQLRAGMVANDRTGDGGPVWRPRRCILLPYIAGSYRPPANAGVHSGFPLHAANWDTYSSALPFRSCFACLDLRHGDGRDPVCIRAVVPTFQR